MVTDTIMRWLVLMIVCVSLCVSVCTQNIRVSVRQGRLRGTTLSTVKGRKIYAFYNVPYAKPPIGQYRFREPQPPDPWVGVRNATVPGKACLQHITQSFLTTGVEDCLYLNIFTPILPNVSAIPPWFSTIVFFHNQVFITGDSNMFRPTFLLDQDVILVTVNFRLGVLGFLSTEDEVVPGNNGLKDQVAALIWVRENIQAFGGDEERVTIAGNTAGAVSVHLHYLSPLSRALILVRENIQAFGGDEERATIAGNTAGAVSVHLHYLSPLSRGLFQQGIAQSGSATMPWAVAENLLSKTQFIAATLNCTTSNSKLMVDCLRTFAPQQLILFTQSYEVFINTPFAPFGPCVERVGERPFLPEYPFRLLERGYALDRPIIFSDCEYEGLYPLAAILNNEEQLDFLNRRWVDVAPYLLNYNETVSEIFKPIVSLIIQNHYVKGPITASSAFNVVKLFGDRQFLADNGRAAALQAKLNLFSPVYFYQFRYRGQNSNSEFYNPADYGNYVLGAGVEGDSNSPAIIGYFRAGCSSRREIVIHEIEFIVKNTVGLG
ncbi:carboxylic ester hydrolase activity protein [Homalodisca vitripennis]|nr:carboxylic ester hydrolase activity protein [Homalodisca vitripennis]